MSASERAIIAKLILDRHGPRGSREDPPVDPLHPTPLGLPSGFRSFLAFQAESESHLRFSNLPLPEQVNALHELHRDLEEGKEMESEARCLSAKITEQKKEADELHHWASESELNAKRHRELEASQRRLIKTWEDDLGVLQGNIERVQKKCKLWPQTRTESPPQEQGLAESTGQAPLGKDESSKS